MRQHGQRHLLSHRRKAEPKKLNRLLLPADATRLLGVCDSHPDHLCQQPLMRLYVRLTVQAAGFHHQSPCVQAQPLPVQASFHQR